jgi:branched-chain amino acid aminotransferase
MDLDWEPDALKQACIDTVKANHLKAAYIRPLVFRGSGTIGVDPRPCPVRVIILTIFMGKYLGPEAIEQGVDVCVSSWGRMAPNTSAPAAKIGGQYVNSQFIKMEAVDNGFSEGIAIDANGMVSEGSGENLFVIRDGVITTPPLSASILRGITRESVITLARDMGYTVREEGVPRETLYMADEIFFSGTAAEITPIRSVDHITIGPGHRGPITEKLQTEFFDIVAGEVEDRHNWLTFVS